MQLARRVRGGELVQLLLGRLAHRVASAHLADQSESSTTVRGTSMRARELRRTQIERIADRPAERLPRAAGRFSPFLRIADDMTQAECAQVADVGGPER